MAIPQNSGNTPARPNASTTSNADTPVDQALDAAVAEVGENPERAAELAGELGIGDSEQPKEGDRTIALSGTSEATGKDPQLRMRFPGRPIYLSHDNRKAPSFAFRLPDGLLVHDPGRGDRNDGRTEYWEEALYAHGAPQAKRMAKTVAEWFLIDEEPIEIVTVLVGYNGIPYGVKPYDPEANKAYAWEDIGRVTAAIAQAAAFENSDMGLDAFWSWMAYVKQSPLWALLLTQSKEDREAQLREDELFSDGPEIRQYVRGLMAGILLERAYHGQRNEYGELVTDVPCRGDVDRGGLKKRNRKAGAR